MSLEALARARTVLLACRTARSEAITLHDGAPAGAAR
jgi:hypothetical protein